MKINSTDNVQMLFRGVVDNSQKYTQAKESARINTVLETKQSVSSFVDVKGSQLDTKA